jgi:hypothetical protein
MEGLRYHKVQIFFILAAFVAAMNLGATAQVLPGGQPTPSSQLTAASPGAPLLGLSERQLDFGKNDIGTTTPAKSVTLTNKAKEAIAVTPVLNGHDFTESNCCPMLLNPDAGCVVSIKYSPTKAGERTGTLTVKYRVQGSNATDLSESIALMGTGNVPRLSILPTEIDFGRQMVDMTSVVRKLKLTASSEASSKTPTIAIRGRGDFTVSPMSCQLEPGASCTLNVTFTPTQLGATTGAVMIGDNATSTPKAILLKGEGVEHCDPGPTLCSQEGLITLAPVLTVVSLYLFGLVMARWNMVARPTRTHLQAHLEAIRKRAEALNQTSDQERACVARVEELLTKAEQLLTGTRLSRMWDWFYWTRGQELASLTYLHEAEEQLVPFLTKDRIRAALECAETDLRQAGTPSSLGLADRIHAALTAVPVLPRDPVRAVLEEVLTFLAPKAATLVAEVNHTLEAKAQPSIDECRQLGDRVLTFLSPQAVSLVERIEQALSAATPATPDQQRLLLQQAADLLKPQANLLATKIKDAGSAATPLTVEQWKALFAEVRNYLMPQKDLLAEQIRQALAADTVLPLDRWKALLIEALNLLYDRSDTSFADVIDWHNKTMWLIVCGLLLIVALAAVLQHGVLFLVGATGGLLSRLERSLYRQDVPTDYGASWTSIFLSPVVGALTGWAGVLLVILLVQLNILGSVVKLDWCNPYSPVALGLALLLGASERLFSGIQNSLEDKLRAQPGTTKPPETSVINILTGPGLPGGKSGLEYSHTLTASGGTSPYKWTLTNGALPAGLKVDPNGQISGMPTAPGTSKFTMLVSDTKSNTKSQEFTIVVT